MIDPRVNHTTFAFPQRLPRVTFCFDAFTKQILAWRVAERLGQNFMMSDFPNLPIFFSTAFRIASFAGGFAVTISILF